VRTLRKKYTGKEERNIDIYRKERKKYAGKKERKKELPVRKYERNNYR
jgi:hypothetical protein